MQDIVYPLDVPRLDVAGVEKRQPADGLGEVAHHGVVAALLLLVETSRQVLAALDTAADSRLVGQKDLLVAAGAAGAGFNVIAQEVRTLADKNTKQANEVESTLNEIKKSITGIYAQLRACNEEIEKNAAVIEKLKKLVDEASDRMKELQ